MRWLLLAVMIVACDKGSGVKLETACTVDDDCDLANAVPPECCSGCSPSAYTRASVEAANTRCRELAKGSKPYLERCPQLSCTCQHSTAHCKAGACVVETGPCQPAPPPAADAALPTSP